LDLLIREGSAVNPDIIDVSVETAASSDSADIGRKTVPQGVGVLRD
jgi:hypothetical protein